MTKIVYLMCPDCKIKGLMVSGHLSGSYVASIRKNHGIKGDFTLCRVCKRITAKDGSAVTAGTMPALKPSRYQSCTDRTQSA